MDGFLAKDYESKFDYPKALGLYERALAIKKEVIGDGHPSTATTYNNIGHVYYDMGDYGKALEYFEKDLRISEEVLGKEHPSAATTYYNMGVLYYYLNDYQSLMRFLLKSYKVCICFLYLSRSAWCNGAARWRHRESRPLPADARAVTKRKRFAKTSRLS